METLRAYLRQAGRGMADFVLPPLCALCRAPITRTHAVCAACWGKFEFLSPPWCDGCGEPFRVPEAAGGLCGLCSVALPPHGKCRAALNYNEAARTIVSRFKYGDQLHLRPLLAPWLTSAGAEVLAGADVLMPVPLHWRRLVRRRYNQAALLAEGVGRASGIPVERQALVRRKATAPQVGQPRAARLQNMQQAFVVRDNASVAGRVVVLVDDVLTTGATLNACAEALQGAGAAEVRALTLARVIRPRQLPD